MALAVFVGHLFPVFFRFKGGKGVATAAGVLFAIDWRIGLGTLATWLVIAFFFRYSSLAALVDNGCAPEATQSRMACRFSFRVPSVRGRSAPGQTE